MHAMRCWKLLVAFLLAVIATISFNGAGSLRYHHHKHEIPIRYDSTGSSIYTNTSYPYGNLLTVEEKDYLLWKQTWKPRHHRWFEEYKCGDSVYNITQEDIQRSDDVAILRREEVRNAFKFVWNNYQQQSYGMDELQPITGKGNERWGGMALTMIDSLDTLWLMGMKDNFLEARDWIRDNLSFDHIGEVSQFETTIRSLGGLLSAYDLSKDVVFLEKAQDLGNRLIKSFDSPNGLPYGVVNLQTGISHNFQGNGYDYVLAEVGTNQLEFRYLSNVSGNPQFADASMNAFDIIQKLQPSNGLLPLKLKDGKTGVEFSTDHISFGGMGDSTYEYMLKLWIQGGKKEQRYRDMWDRSVQGMHEQLLQRSSPSGLTYIAEMKNGKLVHNFGHLTCFMSGALALGAYTDPKGLQSKRAQRDLKTAKSLMYTCFQMYVTTKTGIGPESVIFMDDGDFRIPRSDRHYILRPEVVESLYYLNKLTGDPIYRVSLHRPSFVIHLFLSLNSPHGMILCGFARSGDGKSFTTLRNTVK